MRNNILRNSDVVSVYLFYEEKDCKTKLKAAIRFLDTKECYLATEMPMQFVKPKRKQPAEVIAYTEDGVYRSSVKIVDCNVTGHELLFTTELPSQWNYTQLRRSSRKQISADFTIAFNDGYQIKATTYDISLDGISFYADEPIKDLYTKITGILTMNLPSNSYVDVGGLNIKTEAKFLRMSKNKEKLEDKRYVFKMIGLSEESSRQLKNYLLRLC